MDRFRIFMLWPGPSPENYYRIWLPATYCGRELFGHGVDIHWGPEIPWKQSYDCYWVHGLQDDAVIAYLEARRAAGSRIVWGLDDDYWQIPQDIPEQEWVEHVMGRLPSAEVLRELADMLVVSTELLVTALGFPDKTLYCPNLVEPFDPALPDRLGGMARVLIAGSHVHYQTVAEMLTEPLLKLSRELDGQARFYFWGGCPKRLKGFVTELDRVPYDEYWERLQDIAPDVWLVPMMSDAYMDCKTPLKWLEASRVGAATIASPVPAYQVIQPGIDGILTENWEEPIRQLCSDTSERQRLCGNARQRLLAEFSWASPTRSLWFQAFARALEC